MDALAGYGSDDSSSGDAAHPSSSSDVGALGALMDYSDDDEGHDQRDEPQPRAGTDQVESEASVQSDALSRKRKRHSEADKQESNSTNNVNLLPPPPLSESSLVQWNIDYTEKYRSSKQSPGDKTSLEVVDKLNRLSETSKNTSFAQQLQSQKEFHNPHFFDNVVTHFGIKDPLGSTVAFAETFQPFEFNVVASEEQTRIREQQQRQVSEQEQNNGSEYAKQQVEMAMRSNMSRPG